MSISTKEMTRLGDWLTGWFDNRTQALAEPAWYVHLWLWQRLIPGGIQGQPALFIEQASALTPAQAYRPRVMVLCPDQVQYYSCREPQKWRVSGAQPERLTRLTAEDLIPLPGCVLQLRRCNYLETNPEYEASPAPGYRCEFAYNGQTRRVELGWRVNAQTLTIYDRGVDPSTGQVLWGALMGPYVFHKRA
jgi:hypothetical protein